MDAREMVTQSPAERYAIGSHWHLRIPGNGTHEVVIEKHVKGTVSVIVRMAQPKLGAEERHAEDWDWSNVHMVRRTTLETL